MLFVSFQFFLKNYEIKNYKFYCALKFILKTTLSKMQEFMSHRDTSWKTSALGLLKQKNLFISHPKYIIILPIKSMAKSSKDLTWEI